MVKGIHWPFSHWRTQPKGSLHEEQALNRTCQSFIQSSIYHPPELGIDTYRLDLSSLEKKRVNIFHVRGTCPNGTWIIIEHTNIYGSRIKPYIFSCTMNSHFLFNKTALYKFLKSNSITLVLVVNASYLSERIPTPPYLYMGYKGGSFQGFTSVDLDFLIQTLLYKVCT